VESRIPRSSGHVAPATRDDVDDDDGELVSDGIVTWRRKLPDLGEFGRAPSTVDHHHHHHHHHQRHASKQVADSRKMSIPATATSSSAGRRDRRDAFAQQKSFSYEAGCVGRRLPLTPDELAAAARARRDGGVRGGGGASTTAAFPVNRRRRMLMEAGKKSYSLDDQIAPSHVAASEVTTPMYAAQPYEPPAQPRDAGRLQIGRDTGRSAGREPGVSGERSPSGSGGHRKLLMLHTMRALQHDNYEISSTSREQAPPPPAPPSQPDTHVVRMDKVVAVATTAAALTSTQIHVVPTKPTLIVADPPPRVPPPTSRVDRLPIARIWSRLKFDRRAVTASGKK